MSHLLPSLGLLLLRHLFLISLLIAAWALFRHLFQQPGPSNTHNRSS